MTHENAEERLVQEAHKSYLVLWRIVGSHWWPRGS